MISDGKRSALGWIHAEVAPNVILVWPCVLQNLLAHPLRHKVLVFLCFFVFTFALLQSYYLQCATWLSNSDISKDWMFIEWSKRSWQLCSTSWGPQCYITCGSKYSNRFSFANFLTAAIGCKFWCTSNSQPWSEKCAWPSSCAGCPECSSAHWFLCTLVWTCIQSGCFKGYTWFSGSFKLPLPF